MITYLEQGPVELAELTRLYQSVGLSPIEQTGGACFVRYQAGV